MPLEGLSHAAVAGINSCRPGRGGAILGHCPVFFGRSNQVSLRHWFKTASTPSRRTLVSVFAQLSALPITMTGLAYATLVTA